MDGNKSVIRSSLDSLQEIVRGMPMVSRGKMRGGRKCGTASSSDEIRKGGEGDVEIVLSCVSTEISTFHESTND